MGHIVAVEVIRMCEDEVMTVDEDVVCPRCGGQYVLNIDYGSSMTKEEQIRYGDCPYCKDYDISSCWYDPLNEAMWVVVSVGGYVYPNPVLVTKVPMSTHWRVHMWDEDMEAFFSRHRQLLEFVEQFVAEEWECLRQ